MAVEDFWQYEGYHLSLVYTSPILICVGTVCNVLCVAVMRTASYRDSSTGMLFICLAIADIGVLNTGLLRVWLDRTWGVDVRSFSQAACKIHIFTTYLLGQLSAWTLVIITLERVVSVCWPLRCKELCSRRRLLAGWLCMLILLVGADTHLFWSMALEHYPGYGDYCLQSSSLRWFMVVYWPWIDMALACFVPFVAIFALNIVISVKLFQFRQGRKTTLQASQEKGSEKSTTIMLLSISFTFLLTTTPAAIYFAGLGAGAWAYTENDDSESDAQLRFAYAVCYLLFNLNSTMNFFLYCISGTRFRQAAASVLCHCCARRHGGTRNTEFQLNTVSKTVQTRSTNLNSTSGQV